MPRRYSFRITKEQYKILYDHLFRVDDKEAIAFVVCGKLETENEVVFLGMNVIPVPTSEVIFASRDKVRWNTKQLEAILTVGLRKNYSVLKFHCHPNGKTRFSDFDELSDADLSQSIYGWWERDNSFGSAVMLKDGGIFGRVIDAGGKNHNFERYSVIGDRIECYFPTEKQKKMNAYDEKNKQAFGSGTIEKLIGLRIGVVGCSGTGSLVIQQLAHFNVGALVLVDPDHVEEKNLNRIVGATLADAKNHVFKAEVMKRYVSSLGLGTEVKVLPSPVQTDESVKRLAECDVIFGCVDSIFARNVLNRITTFYIIPFIDLGVRLDADGKGGVNYLSTKVDYLKPGQTLMGRGVFSPEMLTAEAISLANPAEYKARKSEGYLREVKGEVPAVISINSITASLAVTELLARIHGYRIDPDMMFETSRFDLINMLLHTEQSSKDDLGLVRKIGRGDMSPLLDMTGIRYADS